MTAHTPEHEAWLEIAVAGEALSAAQRGAIESCRRCAAELREMGSLQSALGGVAAEDAQVLSSARALRGDPELDEVLALSARTSGRRPAPGAAATPRRARVWPWLAAAGILAVAGWLMFGRERAPTTRDDVQLGDVHVELVAPAGEVGQYSRFAWTAELPPAGWYVLVVRDATTTASKTLLEQRTSEKEWIVPAEVTRTWPARIEWEVRVSEPGQGIVGSASGWASRSP